MTSAKKAAASRINGAKGRGPRSAAGKSRSARNSYQHGLSAIHRDHPLFVEDIERLALAICDGDKASPLFGLAVEIAECEMILRCIADERLIRIERLRDSSATPLTRRRETFAQARSRFRESEIAHDELRYVTAKLMKSKPSSFAIPPPAIREVSMPDLTTESIDLMLANPPQVLWSLPPELDEFSAMRRAVPDLACLDRYRRRAWSRKKRAMREWIRMASEATG